MHLPLFVDTCPHYQYRSAQMDGKKGRKQWKAGRRREEGLGLHCTTSRTVYAILPFITSSLPYSYTPLPPADFSCIYSKEHVLTFLSLLYPVVNMYSRVRTCWALPLPILCCYCWCWALFLSVLFRANWLRWAESDRWNDQSPPELFKVFRTCGARCHGSSYILSASPFWLL